MNAEPIFDTVLVANRGEIALRILRTCRDMGIRTVAVYSTGDRDSAVVRAADRAVHIGPAAARRSYLYAPAIIEAAHSTGAQAIHPGYGFLSEDPDFAEICGAEQLVFIGPPPEVMARLGDKSLARKLLGEAGIPVLPGSEGAVATAEEAERVAARIGCPLIIKAAAGGGGRGMTVVRDPADLGRAYRATRAAARIAFGDDRVYLERYLDDARHIEVQILADRHGNVRHLGERDCSVQRRHQKLIEESPAPELPVDLAERLGAYAVRGARATGYVGAGTFEFLVTATEVALIEVNCRIQVEHPVTEAVTGIDIVAEQLRIAAGHSLRHSQAELVRRGVAIECRINAEDPAHGYRPSPGLLEVFRPPGGPFIRVDTHAHPGYRIPAEYDSLLAKVIAWGPDRPTAIARMRRALAEFEIEGPGVRVTTGILTEILGDPEFLAGAHTTAFLDLREPRATDVA
ncbi:acetyl-CoA carboxylase biotin carboxylase subunit [Nocardia acidivorans]|uniref:acetyl-CoA carboxylase biotin carboxylase subunit n=1 Tax=Nocardia acidivorans TaxID=404580 RepID=UPI0008355E16|nr:acetyl-CoA carboxylase biotin carboxylase subunit [Nocardia acidivorans]